MSPLPGSQVIAFSQTAGLKFPQPPPVRPPTLLNEDGCLRELQVAPLPPKPVPPFPLTPDRSYWRARALNDNPELHDMIERLDWCDRSLKLGECYGECGGSSRGGNGRNVVISDHSPPSGGSISRERLFQLIIQHLEHEGLYQTKEMLEMEMNAGITQGGHLGRSQLMLLLSTLREDVIHDAAALMVGDGRGSNVSDASTTMRQKLQWEAPKRIPSEMLTDSSPPLWEELQESSPPQVVWEDDQQRVLAAASLNRLVEMVTSVEHNVNFMRCFLMTYRSFTTPTVLMQKLKERYQVPIAHDMPSRERDAFKDGVVKPIQLRVCSVLKHWIDEHQVDFTESLYLDVMAFVTEQVQGDHPSMARILRQALERLSSTTRRLSTSGGGGGGHTDSRSRSSHHPQAIAPTPHLPENLYLTTLSLADVESIEIARQLTLITWEIYSAIQPAEFFRLAWSKPKYRHLSPNVLRMITSYNQVGDLVVTSILREPRLQKRSQVYEKWLHVMQCLFSLNNFDSTMAIMAGLNNTAIKRLRFTREMVLSDVRLAHESMALTFAQSNNYRDYRRYLRQATPPCIPYLGVFLSDLTFIEEGNPDTLSGQINYSKRQMMYKVIAEIQQYQKSGYNLQRVSQIANLFRKVPKQSEEELFALSLEYEPKDAQLSQLQ